MHWPRAWFIQLNGLNEKTKLMLTTEGLVMSTLQSSPKKRHVMQRMRSSMQQHVLPSFPHWFLTVVSLVSGFHSPRLAQIHGPRD